MFHVLADANQTNLAKHLLKTICTDITNLLVNAVATEHMLSVSDEAQLTAEVSHSNALFSLIRTLKFSIYIMQ